MIDTANAQNCHRSMEKAVRPYVRKASIPACKADGEWSFSSRVVHKTYDNKHAHTHRTYMYRTRMRMAYARVQKQFRYFPKFSKFSRFSKILKIFTIFKFF